MNRKILIILGIVLQTFMVMFFCGTLMICFIVYYSFSVASEIERNASTSLDLEKIRAVNYDLN